MNTMAIVSELADSGIDAVGSALTELPHWEPIGDDHDAHVVAYEDMLMALDQECRCCCCTGECRDEGYFEDPLMGGFVEGDYDAEAA